MVDLNFLFDLGELVYVQNTCSGWACCVPNRKAVGNVDHQGAVDGRRQHPFAAAVEDFEA